MIRMVELRCQRYQQLVTDKLSVDVDAAMATGFVHNLIPRILT